MSIVRILLLLAVGVGVALPAQAQRSGPTGDGPQAVLVFQQGSRLKVAYPPYTARLNPSDRKTYRVTGPDFEWTLDPAGRDRFGVQVVTPPGRPRAPEGRGGTFLDDVVAGIGIKLEPNETALSVSKEPGGNAEVRVAKTNADGSTSFVDYTYDNDGNEIGFALTPPGEEDDDT